MEQTVFPNIGANIHGTRINLDYTINLLGFPADQNYFQISIYHLVGTFFRHVF